MSKEWTRPEIARQYRLARDKYKQIVILAQLTASDVETIMQILEEEGCLKDKKVCGICGKEYPTCNGKGVCPDCKRKERRIYYLNDKVKQNTAKIQQLGIESARMRAEVDRLRKELKKEECKSKGE